MIYRMRIRNRIRYIKVYTIKEKIGKKENIITKALMALVSKFIKGRNDSMPKGIA